MIIHEHHFVTRDGQEILFCQAKIHGEDYQWATFLPLDCTREKYDLCMSIALKAFARALLEERK